MFDTRPYLKMLIITLAMIFGTLFDLGVVLFDNPPAIFGWMFGVLTGAMWVMFAFLFHSFLHRGDDVD